MLARRIAAADPRFLTTYTQSHDSNFTPREISDANQRTRRAYLPLIVAGGGGCARSVLCRAEEDSAALPGPVLSLPWRVRGAALHRLLIDAGLIKGCDALACRSRTAAQRNGSGA